LKKSSNSKCVSAFSSGDFKMINFSLKIKGGDFNTLTCNGSSCPNDSYSTTQPYYSLTIDTSQCSGCSMPQTTASAHFGVGDNFTIQIACVGSCTSEPITITNNSLDFNFNSNGNQVDSDIELVFNENITDFFIPDINVLVYSENILKRG